jgi:protein-S-isoprenylcysteine O-methyltransferase Ste14
MNMPALAIGTIFIIVFSWFLSIKHKRYHGIARFFSFESILVLLLMNLKIWFEDPFSVHQLISWILMFLSIYFAVAGFLLLRKIGKPQGGNFENTSVIVRTGLYRFIRHPLYLSLMLLGTGIMLKNTALPQIIAGVVNIAAIWFTARIEEREMMAKFGSAYSDYMRETKMFIPCLI